jgi:hypothetical protein
MDGFVHCKPAFLQQILSPRAKTVYYQSRLQPVGDPSRYRGEAVANVQ